MSTRNDQQEALAKARAAKSALASQKEQARLRVLIPLGIFALGYILFQQLSERSREREISTRPIVCAAGDATCIGNKYISASQAPCSAVVATLLDFEPEWTDGLLEHRFDSPGWYEPSRTIVYTGNHLMARNAFGAKRRLGYFCVISATTGSIENAGIPDLGLRLAPMGTTPVAAARSAPPPTPASNVREKHGPRWQMLVTRATFKGKWPLVHSSALLTCTPREKPMQHLSAVTAIIDGREYGVNGTAIGFSDITPYWLDNEENPGAKVSISDFVQAGLSLCP